MQFRILHELIFFLFVVLGACSKEKADIHLLWKGEQVIGVSIPRHLADGISDSLAKHFMVSVATANAPVAMFGNYRIAGNEIIFEPLVPLTRGLRYQILIDQHLAGEIVVPEADPGLGPELLGIYPTQDTLPENLLKVFLHFSRPMRDGQALQHLTMLGSKGDTAAGVFLDLQPELWNGDRTMLTVWLDPGRIKRDLKPNKKYGAPLIKGNTYTLIISDKWKDVQGVTLPQSYVKKFTVVSRDSLSPDPEEWRIHNPEAGTKRALQIDFKEALDFSLLNTTLRILDGKGEMVLGQWNVGQEETSITFIPEHVWVNGEYQLQIETRLEDLAGNNLSRAFEVDVTNDVASHSSDKVTSLTFSSVRSGASLPR